MINLKNTNVVLTGATGGIGNSILDTLVSAEANVLATGTNEEKLNTINIKAIDNPIEIRYNLVIRLYIHCI